MDKKISQLTQGTPLDTDIIPYVDLVAGVTKKAFKSELKGDQGDPGEDGEDGLDITWRGAYSGATTYAVNDAVSYNGSSYICKSSSTGNLPTNPTYWDLMASEGDTGATGATGAQGEQGEPGTGDMESSVYDPQNIADDAFDVDNHTNGTTNKVYTATEKNKLAGIETAADVTDAGNVGTSIDGATGKTTPVNADTMPLIDSAASNFLKKVTWANIKATLKSYFDTLYAAISHTHTQADITNLISDLGNKQPLDSDLTTLASLSPTTDSFIQSKSSAWAARTIAQVKSDLGLSGTNTGDQTSIVGITGIKSQFNSAVTDGDFLYADDIKRIYKSADETVNNSTVLQNDNHLTFPIAANEVWCFISTILFSSGTIPDIKILWSVPSGATGYYGQDDYRGDAFLISDNFTMSGAAATQIAGFYGVIINGATPGNLTLQWAQGTANASDTKVLAGSYIIAHKLA